MIRFYTYDQIANIFRVQKSTVKFWKAKGKLSLYGYRPYKDDVGHRRSEAVFEEREVQRLCEEIFKRGSWYMTKSRDKRLKDDVVNDKVFEDDKVNNQSSIDVVEDSDRDNSHIEGDEVIVNHDDNNPDKTNNQ